MALTADTDRSYKKGGITRYPVKGSTTIYKGSGVMVISGTGYAIPAADTSSGISLGVAIESCDNSSGSDGDKYVRVRKDGKHSFTCTGATVADIGKDVYASDDTTVLMTGQSHDVWVGKIDGYITSNTVWIDIGVKRNVLTTYRQNIIVDITDISSADTLYVPINYAGTITRMSSVLYGTIATANSTIVGYIGAAAITTGTLTIAYSGSATGDYDTCVPTGAATVAQGDYIKLILGHESTNAIKVTVNIEITVNV